MRKRKLQAVLRFGGKGNMVDKIVPILEAIPHTCYCEPFGGAAAILLNKRPVKLETYNDLNSGLVDFFRVLTDPELFQQFYRRVELLPYSRELYNEARDTWEEEKDLIKRVALWFVVARQSFSGRFGAGWGSTVRGMATSCSAWLSGIERLPETSNRLRRVQIEHADWRTILERYDTPETLFYCDPPYLLETRSNKRYKHELSAQDHEDFIARVLELEGYCAISGYNNPLYSRLDDAGWMRRDWETACHAAGKTRATRIQGKNSALEMQPRTESLWLSPNCNQDHLFLLRGGESQ